MALGLTNQNSAVDKTMPVNITYHSIDSATTLSRRDRVVHVTTTGACVLTLPRAALCAMRTITINLMVAGGNLTVSAPTGDNLGGFGSLEMTAATAYVVAYSDGVSWFNLSSSLT